MGKLLEKIDQDLKNAMLSGDKELVETLRGIKSSLQYSTQTFGKNSSINDDEIIRLLQKETKKRVEASELYIKGGDEQKSDKELREKKVIEGYLPKALDDGQISKLIDVAIDELGPAKQENMGKIIGHVLNSSKGLADGSIVARLVKERIQ